MHWKGKLRDDLSIYVCSGVCFLFLFFYYHISLEEAKKIAEKNSLFNELRRVHCMIGVAKGTIEFSNVADSILSMI